MMDDPPESCTAFSLIDLQRQQYKTTMLQSAIVIHTHDILAKRQIFQLGKSEMSVPSLLRTLAKASKKTISFESNTSFLDVSYTA